MAISLSTGTRTAMVDAAAARPDGGAAAGKLRIYTGAKPTSPGDAPTGTLLAEFTLNDPAFATGASGVAALDITPALETTGLAAGTAGWARLLTSTEAAGSGLGEIDGTVTATGGGGDVTMNTTTVSVGLDLTVTAGSLTQPAS